MNESDDVLERNLRRLFTRAYRPVVPTAEFRVQLARRLVQRTPSESSSATRGAATARMGPAFTRRLVAAAAVVLLCACGFLTYRALSRGERAAEPILARGRVAIQHAGSRDWQELDPTLAQQGLDVEREAFEVVTPSGADLTIRFGSPGSIVLGPSSRASVSVDETAHPSVFLVAGSIRVENTAGDPAWGLDSVVANVSVERGEVAARLAECRVGAGDEACLIATLVRGAARVRTQEDTFELRLGAETSFSKTRALSVSVVDDPAPTRTRATAVVDGGDVAGVVAPPAPPNGFATLAGTVVRSADLESIGRYGVTILRKERLPAVATPKRYEFDGTERFSIHPVKPGIYDVYVERAGHAPWIAHGIQIEAGSTHDLTITAESGVKLGGRVVSARDGTPVANALVIVEDLLPAQVILFDADERYWSAAARTNAAGEFEIEHVSAGSHVLRASAPGFAATWSSVAHPAPNAELELRLGEPGSIAGRVSKDDGSSWPGAIVIASFMRPDGGLARFSYAAGVAGSDGSYSIADLPAGDYVILNALDTSSDRESMTAKQVRVEAGAVTTVNLPDQIAGPRFSGRVLDAAGAPLGDLDITLQPKGVADASSWRSQRVSADGRFEFVGLPAGGYEVYVGKTLGEHFTAADEVTVPDAGLLAHEIRLGAGSIRGRAGSRDTSAANAFVLLERMDRDRFVFAGRGRTDANGAFGFENLRPATYRVLVVPAARGFAPSRSGELWVTASGPAVECAFEFVRGATLTVLVRSRDGAPAPGIALTFADGFGQAHTFSANDVTDRAGRFTTDNIAAGTWRVTAKDATGRAITVPIEITVGDERDVVLELP